MKKDPYLNALQIKYAYALTCHKSQGGQWNAVFVDQGYITSDKIDKEFFDNLGLFFNCNEVLPLTLPTDAFSKFSF